MNRLVPLALLPLVAAVLLPFGALPAYACSCVPLTAQEKVNGADVVAAGKVIRLVEGRPPGDPDAVFLAQRYLKGSGPEEIDVDDPLGTGDCGFLDDGSLGEPYVMFLTGQNSPYETSLCHGSIRLAGEDYDQRFLAEVVAITGPGSLPLPSSGDDVPWPQIVVGSALGAFALIGASAIVLRSRIIGRG